MMAQEQVEVEFREELAQLQQNANNRHSKNPAMQQNPQFPTTDYASFYES